MANVYDLLARCIDWATGKAKSQLVDNTGTPLALQDNGDGSFTLKVQTGDTISIGNVEGINAEGAALTAKPVVIGIKDGTGKAQAASTNNPVPTQLTGRKVLLKTLTKTHVGEVAGDNFFGDTVKLGYANCDMLDISNYKYVTVRIKNETDAVLTDVTLRLSANIVVGSSNQIVNTVALSNIASGASLWVLVKDTQILLEPFLGVDFHYINGGGSSGDVKFICLGGKY